MSHEIFISHAVKDKALADAVVDLLQLGLDVSASTIFCSSLESMGIPSGVDFVDHIKQEIQSPQAVIALITPNYLASQFCLCELGATWAMSHKLFPLLVKPLTYEDVKGVLVGTQLTAIDDAGRLTELRDQLISRLTLQAGGTARWEVKRDVFLDNLPQILEQLPAPGQVLPATHAKVVEELADAKTYIRDQEGELTHLKELVAQLEKAKDKSDVAAIKHARMGELERLEEFELAVRSLLKKLPKCVSLVVCKELGLEQPVKADFFNDRDLADELLAAAGKELITSDDFGVYSLNERHPKIRPVVQAFHELKGIIESASSELIRDFEKEHQITLSVRNIEYWQMQLDGRL